ncbi:MAG: STAS domain-containing protein [Lysobacterales bacterium]
MNGCEEREQGEYLIVAVSGEVDLSWSSELRSAILDALGKRSAVLVDLDQVSYIDSSGIAALVEGYQTAKTKQAKFGLVSISESVKAVLELARLDQVFPIYADVSAAG